ncbi:MAG TPA: 50S ribosomal protein L25 [Thermomicrobiales bacterium]
MAELILRAEPRTIVGKGVRRLRREGKLPGVVYGPGIEGGTVQVTVDRKELERMFAAHGHSTLVTLKWDGSSRQVFIREVQMDPIKSVALHVDFFAPNLRQEVVASVPVVLHLGSEKPAGILTQLHSEIQVRALPTKLPPQIEADASHLTQVGDVLRVGDLKLPEGVTAVTPEDEVIATIAAGEREEVPVEEEAPAPEAPAAAPAATAEGGEAAAES